MKVDDLHALLPAGEWADLQLVNQPPGLLAGRGWARLAKAKRIRGGGRAAFIKFFVAAGSEAGNSTLVFTGCDRLTDMFERLQQIQKMGDRIPIVPLLEIRQTESGLLVAMEEVTPVGDLIERGEAYHLSARILEDLDPDINGGGWHHFDVCPRNIGLLPSGRCVLIDLDSFYLETEGKYNISVPAWKPFRAPRGLVVDVQDQLGAGGIDRSLAGRKLRFEVALAAAECVLGPIPFAGQNQNLDRRIVEAWVERADSADAAVLFWKRELLAVIDTAVLPPLQELREKLESALAPGAEPTGAPLVQAPTGDAESVQLPEISISAIQPDPAQSDWLNDWALMLPTIHTLRAGKLSGEQVVEYRQALLQIAARHPTQADVWNELLLVVISYEKNAALALSLVTEALEHIPGNDGLVRMRNIIQMWARERKHGSY
jgi:hypothetical protein